MAKSVEDYVIDFSKEEESGGGAARYKEGTYAVKIIAAKPTSSSEKGTPGLEVIFQFTEGKYKGKKVKDTLWATPKAYGRFRSLLEACGKKVPTKVNLVKIAKVVKGSELYIELQDEAREGYSTRSRVSFDGFINEDDYDPESAADDDDEDDDEDEDEDLDEDDEEEDEDEDDEDEEDEDEDDEEEEEEKPKAKKKAKSKAKPKAKGKKKKAKDDDDEELEELDLEDF